MDIELRIKGKKIPLEIREDGTFLVKTHSGLREPTTQEKIAVGVHVANAVKQIRESQAKTPKDIINGT